MKEALNNFRDKCYDASATAGWWTDLSTGQPIQMTKTLVSEKLMLIVTEIAEAMEGNRKDCMDTHLTNRKMIEVELADAMIRIGDLAGKLNLDIGGAIEEKMQYNANRADHKIENRMKPGGKQV